MYFFCSQCTESFSRKSNLKRHVQEHHEGKLVKHSTCSKLSCHDEGCTYLPKEEKNGITRIVTDQAFGGMLKTIRFYPDTSLKLQPDEYLQRVSGFVNDTLQILRTEGGYNKIVTKICVRFKKIIDEGESIFDESYFTVSARLFCAYDFNDATDQLLEMIDSYNERGSNWFIDHVLFLDLDVIKYY